jgi:hypothetical protein
MEEIRPEGGERMRKSGCVDRARYSFLGDD